MDSTRRDDRKQDAAPSAEPDRLMMRSVVSYEHLLGMIEERNPILAQREHPANRPQE